MTSQEQPHAIIYHYSAAFRDLIAQAITDVGMEPQVFEDPEIAQSAINGSEGGIVAVKSEFLPLSDGSLQIAERGISLIERANELRTPWNLIVHRTDEPPYDLMRKGLGLGEISLTGNPVALSIEERLADIHQPTKEAGQIFVHSLTNSLSRVLLFKSLQ